MRKEIKEKNRGFTLVELMVAMTIFLLLITVVSQAFIYSLKMERFLVAHSQLMNEMTYNLEHITRGLRMAKKSTDAAFDVSCLTAKNLNFYQTSPMGPEIKFLTPNAIGGVDCVRYYLDTPAGYSVVALMESRANATQSFDVPLTSPDITVLGFSVTGLGWDQNDQPPFQPRVTLYINAKDKLGEAMEIQTTISQRNPDIRK